MDSESTGRAVTPSFDRPTSVLLLGPSSTLLDWVAFAFARLAPGGYHWTDVRFAGQSAEPLEPFERGVIPPAWFAVRNPRDFPPDDARANAAFTVGARPGERTATLEQLTDLLRLPTLTQTLINSRHVMGNPLVILLSNAQRMAPLYSREVARGLAHALIARGVTVFVMLPDEPPASRDVFENYWHIDQRSPHSWREAVLTIERASPAGPIPRECTLKLVDLPFVSSVLSEAFPLR